jgi:hypothetical protein
VAYRVRIHPRVVPLIQGWALPDRILEEVYLHLTQVLPADLEGNLSRETSPFNGMVCEFTRRDHSFVFHVFFGEDEDHLLVWWGDYDRRDNQ